jgi:hypothetical protein
MEILGHLLLAFILAVLLAPQAENLRDSWQSSLFSNDLIIFTAPRGFSKPKRSTNLRRKKTHSDRRNSGGGRHDSRFKTKGG